MSRLESDRSEIIKSRSPLTNHSLNQGNLKRQREGILKIFGLSKKEQRSSRRERGGNYSLEEVLVDWRRASQIATWDGREIKLIDFVEKTCLYRDPVTSRIVGYK